MRAFVRIRQILGLLCALVCVSLFLAQPASAQSGERDLENGKTMFFAGGCTSCHAAPASGNCDDPKIKDKFSLAGGRCLKTDFGTFRVPNISPDTETGIGGWSDDDFVRAMKEGVSPDGEHYYPAFPYTSYQHMREKDLLDLKAFIDTLPAVDSDVPDHELDFPYNIRETLIAWKWLYLDGKTFEPDPAKSGQINRGAYLVQGPGHCAECHSPRNLLGAVVEDKVYSGGPNPEGKGVIPNITPHETGIADWSEDDIVTALETGLTPEFDSFGGNMVKVQENMAQLNKSDLEAIAAYLKSLPPIPASAGAGN